VLAQRDALVHSPIDQHELAGAGAALFVRPVQDPPERREIGLPRGVHGRDVAVRERGHPEGFEEITEQDVSARVIDAGDGRRLVHGDDADPANCVHLMRKLVAVRFGALDHAPDEILLAERQAVIRAPANDQHLRRAKQRSLDGILGADYA
jgi:hypothetical protein